MISTISAPEHPSWCSRAHHESVGPREQWHNSAPATLNLREHTDLDPARVTVQLVRYDKRPRPGDAWKAGTAEVRVTVDSGETGDVAMTMDDMARIAVLVTEYHDLSAAS